MSTFEALDKMKSSKSFWTKRFKVSSSSLRLRIGLNFFFMIYKILSIKNEHWKKISGKEYTDVEAGLHLDQHNGCNWAFQFWEKPCHTLITRQYLETKGLKRSWKWALHPSISLPNRDLGKMCKKIYILYGDAGDWTRGLSHAKRTRYHCATSPFSINETKYTELQFFLNQI